MKKFVKILAVLLSVVIPVFSFAACAKGSMSSQDRYDSGGYKNESLSPDVTDDYYAEKPSLDFEGDVSQGTDVNTSAEKIIYTAQCVVETKEFDKTISALDALVAKYGGFIEQSNVTGNTYRDHNGDTYIKNRYAKYTLRIPATSFDSFLNETGTLGVVISKNQQAQNITSQFTDTQARMEAYKIQEERLLALLEKADTMDAIITIEDKLTNVRYNIEALQRNLNNMQSKVDYSTVNLSIDEVEIYTPVEEPTFIQRLGDSIVDSWNSFVDGLGDFVIWIVYAIPTLIILAGIAVLVIILVKKRIKKERAKKSVDNQSKQ